MQIRGDERGKETGDGKLALHNLYTKRAQFSTSFNKVQCITCFTVKEHFRRLITTLGEGGSYLTQLIASVILKMQSNY